MQDSRETWKSAGRPNYSTNKDKVFFYSEIPYIGKYKLVKIPESLKDTTLHVDYWGEGLVTENGTRGFKNCYNVNHQYRLVSAGADKGRKIPNRIPIDDECECDTSAYIKDKSVSIVTVMGAPINLTCAADIARIVNDDGKVIAYGYDEDSEDIKYLITQLEPKGLFHTPGYALPAHLQSSTYKKHMAFLNQPRVEYELTESIANGEYEDAVLQIKDLDMEVYGDLLKERIMTLIKTRPRNLMLFGYKLWHAGAQNVVKYCFPTSYSLIFSGEKVTLINKKYNQALKLDWNINKDDRAVWGDVKDQTSERMSWKLISVADDDRVTFKLFNDHRSMYVKLDVNADHEGDRRAWGSTIHNENRFRYYLEPQIINENLSFCIVNYEYHQGLKLALAAEAGDRALWGHNGSFNKTDLRFNWIIAAF